MKLKATSVKELSRSGVVVGVLTTTCPYPIKCSRVDAPKVGSIACHNCEQCKSWTDGVVYCKAGDKARTVKKETTQ